MSIDRGREKHPYLRGLANGLPLFRAAAGVAIAQKIRKTPAEERTWKFATGTALVAGTDKLDGFITKYIGRTRLGGWLDQIGDKIFAWYILKALGDTGEISGSHHNLKLGRDIGVTAMRGVAELYGINTDAQKVAKIKTAAEMGTIVLATSPISEHTGLLEIGAGLASGLSIISGADYAKNFGEQIISSIREV